MNNKLLLIAGEASGDLHGSNLIVELKNIDDSIEIYGIGGDKMINAGMKPLYHINEMSFLGFIEVIKHLPFIKRVKKELIELVTKEEIKNVVLIDYPGFNLSMAKSFKNLGIKNIYYISPQIWAWGKGRIKKIRRLVERMIVFFPFEKKLYSKNGVNSDFVGHPLVKILNDFKFKTREEIIETHNLRRDKEILLLLPGSRDQEIEKILPSLLEASKNLTKEFNLQAVIACADNIDTKQINSLNDDHAIKIIKGDTYNLLRNSMFAIVKSGTSTLEAGIIGTPFIVVYKTNYFTYLIGKSLIKIKNIALANIVAEKTAVPELIQNDVNPEKIYSTCASILADNLHYKNIKDALGELKNKLMTVGNPSKKAAEIIYNELNAN